MASLRTCSVVLAVAVVAVPAVAIAQPAQPLRERHGVFAGGGIYGGNISCDGDDCGGFRAAGGAALHIGYNFTPRLGLLLDVWAMTSDSGNAAITFASGTIGVRWWLAPVLWLHGGVNGHAIVRVAAVNRFGSWLRSPLRKAASTGLSSKRARGKIIIEVA